MTKIDPMDDALWEHAPTALEIAHYNDVLKRCNRQEDKLRETESERARRIFGECLLKLTKLGMTEAKARPMLGKWRKAAGDDLKLIAIVNQAAEIATPDPVSYITKALQQNVERKVAAKNQLERKWEVIGWEPPMIRRGKKVFRSNKRCQVWRDPHGKMKLLPPAPDIEIPTLAQDPGIELKK